MEENKLHGSVYRSKRQLLCMLSQQKNGYRPQQVKIITKMNQCFAPQNKRSSKGRLPLEQLKKLGSTHLLTKHRNKIQQNIQRHRQLQSRATHYRMRKQEKKTQLIINKPYYLQFFKPKTIFDILDRHKVEQENTKIPRKVKHKSSITSLHQSGDGQTMDSNILHLNRSVTRFDIKGTKNNKMTKLPSFKTFNSTMGSTFGSFLDFKKPVQKKFNQELTLYTMKELECYYYSMIKFSRGEPKRYKQGLQTMLNLMNVPSNQKVLLKEFCRFQKNPTFEEFIEIYNRVVDANLRQNIMDFFDIIFDECGGKQLSKQQLTSLLYERMPKTEAIEIVDEILFLVKSESKMVSITDVLTLCCTDDEFCIFMKQFSILDDRKK